MGDTRRTNKKLAPTMSPEAKENQLINLAIKLAEKQLMDGSASSQVITHFLKLATVKEKLTNEKLRSDLKVAEAKIKQMAAQEEIKDLFKDAMAAMKDYTSFTTNEVKEDD